MYSSVNMYILIKTNYHVILLVTLWCFVNKVQTSNNQVFSSKSVNKTLDSALKLLSKSMRGSWHTGNRTNCWLPQLSRVYKFFL